MWYGLNFQSKMDKPCVDLQMLAVRKGEAGVGRILNTAKDNLKGSEKSTSITTLNDVTGGEEARQNESGPRGSVADLEGKVSTGESTT